ncbi:MAG: YceI family protein [Lysobacteraceae bacterium]
MTFRAFPIVLLPLIWLMLAGNAMAQAREYRIDPDHSRVLFKVEHLGLSRSIGTFSDLSGEFRFDEERWSDARVSVNIPLASLDLGDADWQKKVLDDYLQADRLPQAYFEASELMRDEAETNSGRLSGELTLNGVTRPVELQLHYNGSVRSLYTKLKRKAGFSASTTIRRSDFGLDKQLDLVGDEVHLEIEVEGIRQREPRR